MPDPSSSSWKDAAIAVLSILSAGGLGSQLLTLRQSRRKLGAEARSEEVKAGGGIFDMASREMGRMEKRIQDLEAQRDRIEAERRKDREEWEGRLFRAESELQRLRLRLIALGDSGAAPG